MVCGVMTCENLFETPLAAISSTELKNGIGEGGSESYLQSQCDYLAFYSAVLVRVFFCLNFSKPDFCLAANHCEI